MNRIECSDYDEGRGCDRKAKLEDIEVQSFINGEKQEEKYWGQSLRLEMAVIDYVEVPNGKKVLISSAVISEVYNFATN